MPSGKTIVARTNTASVPVAHPDAVKTAPMNLAPTDIAYYSQPMESAAKWHGRGFTVAVKAERRIQNGVPTISLEQWDAATIAGGITKLIREPRDNPRDDVGNPNLLYWLYPLDEPDNAVVEARDNGRDPEAVYVAVEQWCAKMRAVDPTRPLAVNVGVEQSRWPGKVDYPRLLKPFDRVICDYYGVLRGFGVAQTLDIIKTFRDTIAAGKLCLWFIEATDQNLTYGAQRAPTVAEEMQLLAGCHALGLVPGIFSQVLASPAKGIDFSYDGIDAPHLSVIAVYLASVRGTVTPPDPTPTPPAATLPDVLTINGRTYKAQ